MYSQNYNYFLNNEFRNDVNIFPDSEKKVPMCLPNRFINVIWA